MSYKCEHCGTEEETEFDLEIKHRSCRLKAAFPGAYTERGDGLISFDMKKISEALGLFDDIVIGRDGQPLHPLEGDLHFRVSAGWVNPEIWIELPVQVGNQLSSFSFRLTEPDWQMVVQKIGLALQSAHAYLTQKELARQNQANTE